MEEIENQYLEDMLEETIGEQIEKFRTAEPGSDDYKESARVICEFWKICIEYTTAGMEYREKEEQRLSEERFKAQQLDIQKHNNFLQLVKDYVLGFTGIAVPAIIYVVLYNKGLKFEETGSYTSGTVKNLVRFFKPTKV